MENEILKLTDLLNSPNISESDRVIYAKMRRLNLEKYITDHHKNAICRREKTVNGKVYESYYTRLNGKKITAKSLELLYEKLYEFYSGSILKDKATFKSTFEDAIAWRYSESQNATKRRNIALYNARIKGTAFDRMPLKDVKPHDIRMFLRNFSNNVRASELKNIKTLINLVFSYACEELEIIPYNVAAGISIKGIKTLPEKNVGRFAYTQIEAKMIVSYLINTRNVYYEAICFAFYVGLRFSEISDLRWTDIEDRILMITHANTESGNLKNGEDSVRTLYLCDEAVSLLERYKSERPDSEWIFPNKAGNHIFNNRLNEYLHKVCDELDIKYRPSHKIRAYAITQVSTSGDFESARKFAGHTDYRMTLRYINGQITDANRRATESLNLGIPPISTRLERNKKTS